ncbi:MAG: type II toxin-antitoxin system RelE/ParE family toxin [Myroides sp.]|nr:type II toxin-antitoxin system RelE/ParE family toxin [uncultured Flavobacterium sp.]MDO5638056.1 type II toxin-antitoxin system RelE/ParE family toxin [Myroides sp.]
MSDISYVLSEKAEVDLEEIFDYTCEEFGFNQAEKYLLEIESVFLFPFQKSIFRYKSN